ncbi:adenylate/guanylate cyclase domain-containing protein [Deltaproteobacteria bacterium TL4]
MPFPAFLATSFRNKLLLSVTTLLIFTVSMIMLVVNTYLKRASDQKIEGEMLVTINVLREFRETQLKSYSDAAASLIRYNPQLRASLSEYNQVVNDLFGEAKPDSALRYQALEEILQEVELFQQSRLFIITDGQGNVLYQKGADYLVNKNLADLPVVNTALSGNELFTWWGASSPIYSDLPPEQPSQPQMLYEVFFKPVIFGKEVVGLLIIGFASTEELYRIKNITLSEIAFFQQGHLYASSAPSELNVQLRQVVEKMEPQRSKALYSFEHGKEQFMAMAHAVKDGMANVVGHIIIFRSQTQELVFYSHLSRVLNMIALLGIATAVFFSVVFSRSVVRTIQNLSTGADAVKNGNLEVQLPILSQDELGQLAQAFNSMIQGLQEKERITRTFKKYVNSSIVDEILKSRVTLGGEKKDVTIYFSDIANFTTFSEKLPPEELLSFLNQYLTKMAQILEQHSAIVDKYIGDAIMAFWGAPLHAENHARLACLTALVQAPLQQQFQDQWTRYAMPSRFVTRIGIHSGEAIVGNIGSEDRMDYTIIGNAVNLASRLESLNKFYGTSILISENTFRAIDPNEFLTRTLDSVQVKGKSEMVQVYELMGFRNAASPQQLMLVENFHQGVTAYHQRNFQTALRHFEQCLQTIPDDSPAELFIQRCRNFIAQPPDTSWNGVQVMLEK